MNRYKVAVSYEEGFTFEVDARSKQKAEKVAKEMINEFAGVNKIDDQNVNTVHRDWQICEVEYEF
jgi:hypothetical protein